MLQMPSKRLVLPLPVWTTLRSVKSMMSMVQRRTLDRDIINSSEKINSTPMTYLECSLAVGALRCSLEVDLHLEDITITMVVGNSIKRGHSLRTLACRWSNRYSRCYLFWFSVEYSILEGLVATVYKKTTSTFPINKTTTILFMYSPID